jgi:large subunit ribosomal protein L29
MRELHVSRIRELTADEVTLKIKDLREELFNLNFRNSMRQLDNPLKIRELRRDMARLMTVLEEHRRGIRSLGVKDTATEGAEGAAPARKSAKPKTKATAKKKTAAKAKAGSKSKAPGRAAAGKATRARTAGMAKSAGKTKSATRAK